MIPNRLISVASFTPNLLQCPSAWLGHLPFAAWVIQEVSPKIFVELGTHYGHSYFSFCQSVVEAGIPSKCYAVDTWQGDEHAGQYNDEVFASVNAHNTEHYAGFSRLLRMTFDDAVCYFSDGSIDLLHIDGLHTYDAVRHDFETWLPKLARGAVVMFHDTNVRERNFGVWKLWEELQARYPNSLEFVHSHGLGVLQLNNATEDKKLEWLHPSSPEKQRLKNYFAALGSRYVERFELKQHASNLNQTLAERDEKIANLNQALAGRDGQIANLNQAVAERDGQISSLIQTVAERDRQIESLDQTVAERDNQLVRLENTISDRESRIIGLKQELTERDHRIQALMDSHSWRLAAPLRAIGSEVRRVSTYRRLVTRGFVRAAGGLKDVPAAISRWGYMDLSQRVLRVMRKNGIRGLLTRAEAFRSLHAHEAIRRQLHEASQRPQQMPLPQGARNEHVGSKVAYVVNSHDLMTQSYRVQNYSEALVAHGFTSVILRDEDISPETMCDADLLVLCRIPWSENVGHLIQRFRDKGRPTIFDIDDFLIDRSQIHLLRFTNGLAGDKRELVLSLMQRLEKTMRACDLATVSTFPLKCEVEKRGLPAFVLPNNNGLPALELARSITRTGRSRTSVSGLVRIGYFSGTKTHEEDFAECAEGLRRVLEENPDAEVMVVGHLELPPLLARYENRIKHRPLLPHHDMLKVLATVDINLAPLERDNLFTDCKSELKIFEAALFGIPTIASPTSTFAVAIENGKSGYLAATPEEWYAALNALIKDGDLRRRIGEAAKNSIAARYAVTTTVNEAKAIYAAAISGRLRRIPKLREVSRSEDSRPLVTIVSVLYRKALEVRYFLEALNRQDFARPFEIILVDDRTPDDSVSIANDFQKWVAHAPYADGRMTIHIQRNATNIGNCGSRNAAIRQARGDVIIVVDADCMFNRSFLSTHFAAHAMGDCDVAIGPINIETNGEPPLSVLGRHEACPVLAETEALPQDAVNLDSFVNCITRNFSIQRSFIEQRLGGTLFDEAFAYSADPQSGFGWEDVEMGYRVYAAGGRIKYLPDTVSIHVSHESSANEKEKPVRSLRNYRRLFEKHPDILTASRQWSIQTYEAILGWARSVGYTLDHDPDYQWLELRFRRYRQAPIIIDRSRKLRILTHRWHVPHQYELYKSGHDFTLLTGTGTSLCDTWEPDKRPMPSNARMIPAAQIDVRNSDLAVLHFDENILRPDLCHGKVPGDWGQTIRWFLEHVDLPKVAICHGTPQFIGQYNRDYKGADLGQVMEAERKAIVDLIGDIPVVCNSHQAQFEWGFRNSTTIWHGFSPHEFPQGSHDLGVLVMLEAALRNRPHYNGLFVFEDVRRLVGSRIDLDCLKTPEPMQGYSSTSPGWAVAKYQNYVRQVGRYGIYFNPTVRSPMPRARGEAMMAGLVSVSLRNHDVDLFIKNGFNGFYADSPEELAEQLLWLSTHPKKKEKIGRASRATAMDSFNQDRYLADWSRLLKTFVS